LLCRYVDVTDMYGYSPMHHATAERKPEAVATLLAYDANMIGRTTYRSAFFPG